MQWNCPQSECKSSLKSGLVVRFGYFRRACDSRQIQRFLCRGCGHTFSTATMHPCYRQHQRRVNYKLLLHLVSGGSLRRAAMLFHLNRKTVYRKLKFLGRLCRRKHHDYLRQFVSKELRVLQFDEMETFEHTKLKPLSLPLVVTKKREILAFRVASMPAKGLLSSKSLKKYGPRKDRRAYAMRSMLRAIKPFVSEESLFESDQNPTYPNLLKEVFPNARHVTTPGGRGCIVGQGELKKLTWDPLFSLNHTAAMKRANINRLFRRTWCTTKKPRRLIDHLSIYVWYHNTVLLKR